MSQTREQAWTEYQIVCTKGKNHLFKSRDAYNSTYQTVHREIALANLGYLDSPSTGERKICDGRHSLESRIITRVTTTTEWGPLDMSAPGVSTRERILHEALKHVCPKCGADMEEMCINLSKKNANPPQQTHWPHSERMDLAGIDRDGAMIR